MSITFIYILFGHIMCQDNKTQVDLLRCKSKFFSKLKVIWYLLGRRPEFKNQTLQNVVWKMVFLKVAPNYAAIIRAEVIFKWLTFNVLNILTSWPIVVQVIGKSDKLYWQDNMKILWIFISNLTKYFKWFHFIYFIFHMFPYCFIFFIGYVYIISPPPPLGDGET